MTAYRHLRHVAPEADISVLKACWYQNQADAKAQCSSWSLAKALDAAITSGARIINLSLAGPSDELMTKLLETAHARGINGGRGYLGAAG